MDDGSCSTDSILEEFSADSTVYSVTLRRAYSKVYLGLASRVRLSFRSPEEMADVDQFTLEGPTATPPQADSQCKSNLAPA